MLLNGSIIFNGNLQEILKKSGKTSLENAIAHVIDDNGDDKVH